MPTLPRLKPERVRADHRSRHAAEPALVDAAEAVDEEVVADVVPAPRLHVEDVDATDDGRRLFGRVGVRRRGVVDVYEPDCGCVPGMVASEELVRAPGRSRDDRRRPRHGESAERAVLDRAPDVVRAEPGDGALRPVLQPVGCADPARILVVRRLPRAPATRHGVRPEADRARSVPAQADHVEPVRRPCRDKRTLAPHRQVARHHRHAAGRRCSLGALGRRQCDEERDQCDQADSRHSSCFRLLRMMPRTGVRRPVDRPYAATFAAQ